MHIAQLKKWLTIDEAANYITKEIGVDVSRSDLLHLATENQITISVKFTSQQHGYKAKYIDIADVKIKEFIGLDGEKFSYFDAVSGNGRLVEVDKSEQLFLLDDIFDLPLVGGETIRLNEEYYQSIGQNYEEHMTLDGVFVEHPTRGLFKLMECESRKYNEVKAGESRWWHYPSGVLPPNSILIVKTENAAKLIATLKSTKNLSTREANNAAKIIAALVEMNNRTLAERFSLAKELEAITEKLNSKVSDDTIVKWLDLAAEQTQ